MMTRRGKELVLTGLGCTSSLIVTHFGQVITATLGENGYLTGRTGRMSLDKVRSLLAAAQLADQLHLDFLNQPIFPPGETKDHASGFFFLISPSTILYSNSRHSRAPLNSGVRLDAARRMSCGRRMSALRIYARQPVKFFFSASPSFG